jgi:hypothetical protein
LGRGVLNVCEKGFALTVKGLIVGAFFAFLSVVSASAATLITDAWTAAKAVSHADVFHAQIDQSNSVGSCAETLVGCASGSNDSSLAIAAAQSLTDQVFINTIGGSPKDDPSLSHECAFAFICKAFTIAELSSTFLFHYSQGAGYVNVTGKAPAILNGLSKSILRTLSEPDFQVEDSAQIATKRKKIIVTLTAAGLLFLYGLSVIIAPNRVKNRRKKREAFS